jgi:KDO2-lipid IV(A) lauroyltransferase
MDEGEPKKTNLWFRLVEYFLLGIFYLTKWLSLILPPTALYSLFDALGYIVFCLRPGGRQRLMQKISDALPEVKDSEEIKRIARYGTSALFFTLLDLVLLWRHSDRIMTEIRIEGEENLVKADAMGKGVLLMGVHMGLVSTVCAIMSRLGWKYTPIVWHPNDTPVPRYIMTVALFAQSLGCDPECPVFWAGQDILEKVQEHLRSGKRVGMTIDVDGNCVVEFFGRPAALASGIAHFHINTGAPIVPFMFLRGRRFSDYRIVISEPLTFELSGDRKKDVKEIMQTLVRIAESQIRQAPEQWMNWFGLWHWWGKAKEIEDQKSRQIN